MFWANETNICFCLYFIHSLNIDLGCMSCSENIKYLAATLMLICGHRPHVCNGMSYYHIYSEDQVEVLIL